MKKYILSSLLCFKLLALEIRVPYTHEIKEIAELYHDAWHNTYDPIAPHLSSIRTPENCLKQWSEYCGKSNSHFVLIARQNNKIVGVVFAMPIQNKTPKECLGYDSEIDKLYVLPGLKNQGIGSQLLKASFGKLHILGFKKPIVRCLTKNTAANQFYEKRGGVLLVKHPVSFNETMNIYGFAIS